jgi:hypothetical protein
MAQRVDGHPPSDNSDKIRLREASITGANDEVLMMIESLRNLSWSSGIRLDFASMQPKGKSKRVFFIPSSFVIRHSLWIFAT